MTLHLQMFQRELNKLYKWLTKQASPKLQKTDTAESPR